jgi:hypothetical protein
MQFRPVFHRSAYFSPAVQFIYLILTGANNSFRLNR